MNRSKEPVTLLPPGVVTAMSTEPVAPAGEVATHVVAVEHATAVAVVPPNLAVVDPVTNPVPVTVTKVPPASGPATGVMAVTVGTGS